MSSNEALLTSEVRATATAVGLDVFGVSRPRKYSETVHLIESRREAGYFGAMRFTMHNPEISCDPAATMPKAKSVVTCGLSYYAELPAKPFGRAARIGAYARKDFYSELRRRLEKVADLLRERGFEAVVLADSNKLTDRPPAVEAGIGRYGKNSMVITFSKGSWVLLGSILTTAPLKPGSPKAPDCGACSACIRRCPTGAIVEEGVIDARRCLAYLLQAPGDIPEDLREAVGDRLYGCDDCQSCCPLNKVSGDADQDWTDGPGLPDGTGSGAGFVSADGFWVDPVEILAASDSDLKKRFGHFYVPRRDFDYLRRNALVVLGNCGSAGDMAAVEPFLVSENPMLRRHAGWAASRLGSKIADRASTLGDQSWPRGREKGTKGKKEESIVRGA